MSTGSPLVDLVVLGGGGVPFAYEAVTLDATAGGVGLTAATYSGARSAFITLETGQIRFIIDGSTAPTALVGHLLEVGQNLNLGEEALMRFKGFRTTATSGAIKVTYFK